MNKGIIRLATKEQYAVEHNITNGLLRNRNRPIIELTFTGSYKELLAIAEAFHDPVRTEEMVLIYHGDDPTMGEEMLEGVAQDVLEMYVIPGEFTEDDAAVEEETPTSPAVYKRKLTVKLGQLLYGEDVDDVA